VHHVRQGSGPPLVLIGETACDWQVWRPVLAPLSAERDVIAVDLPGVRRVSADYGGAADAGGAGPGRWRRCWTSVVWGARDLLLPARQAARAARVLPGARVTVLPGAGHLSMFDAPREVTSAILGGE
jgi:pimeloyl-ACP methyl ester carboxylesterase